MNNKKQHRKEIADEVFANLIDPELAELIEGCDDISCDADTTRILRSRKSNRKQKTESEEEKKTEIKELSEGSMFKKVNQRQKEAISKLKKR